MKNQGHIALALLFVLLISFAGMGLLTHSILHDKIGNSRLKSGSQSEKLYRQLYLHLHRFLEKLNAADANQFPAPESDFFNRENFPDSATEGCRVRGLFRIQALEASASFERLRIIHDVEAAIPRPVRAGSAQISVDLLKGRIPLDEIPLFVSGEAPENMEQFLETVKIKIPQRERPVITKPEVEFRLKDYLLDCFKIKGTALGWPEIREKLRMEISDEPIQEGLYLIQEGETVEAVFIQGDVDRLRFSIDGDKQAMTIYFHNTPYGLKYIPGRCAFEAWDSREESRRCFKEKIMVNGNIWNLEQEGAAAFTEGARIQVLAAGKIVIQSSLAPEPPLLKKITVTHIALIPAARNLVSQKEVEAGIVFHAQEDIQIHATLISAGKTINQGRKVRIEGSLYSKGIENAGVIEMHYLPGRYDTSGYFSTADFRYWKNILVHSFMEAENE